MRTGVCANQPACANAVAMRPLELYPGPGLFCPDCGERLVPLPAPDVAPLEQAETPPAVPRRLLGRLPAFAALAVVSFAAGSAAVFVHSTASGGAARPIHVCRSSAAERLAGDVVRAYAGKSGIPGGRFVATGAACDVRFAAAPGRRRDAIAADGLVAVVNPVNPVGSLSADQIRRIYSGAIRDWSEVGGRKGAIRAFAPAASTDEARALEGSLLRGVALGRRVERLASSAAIAAAVTGAAAHRAIGLAAFSAAAPAKVIAVTKSPPPSALSIADGKYPYTLAVVVDQEQRADAAAAGLVAFARSAEAQSIVTKDGLVPREGP